MIGFSIKYYHEYNIKSNTTNKIIFNVIFIITMIILISLEIMITRTYQIIILFFRYNYNSSHDKSYSVNIYYKW